MLSNLTKVTHQWQSHDLNPCSLLAEGILLITSLFHSVLLFVRGLSSASTYTFNGVIIS